MSDRSDDEGKPGEPSKLAREIVRALAREQARRDFADGKTAAEDRIADDEKAPS